MWCKQSYPLNSQPTTLLRPFERETQTNNKVSVMPLLPPGLAAMASTSSAKIKSSKSASIKVHTPLSCWSNPGDLGVGFSVVAPAPFCVGSLLFLLAKPKSGREICVSSLCCLVFVCFVFSMVRSLRTFERHCVLLCTTLLRRRVAELSNLCGWLKSEL